MSTSTTDATRRALQVSQRSLSLVLQLPWSRRCPFRRLLDLVVPWDSCFPIEGGCETHMWNVVGLAFALFIAAIAFFRSRTRGGYYDTEVYGMVPSTHRRYSAISLAFALFFAVALGLRAETAGTIALSIYVVIALLYLTSFIRGYADVDE